MTRKTVALLLAFALFTGAASAQVQVCDVIFDGQSISAKITSDAGRLTATLVGEREGGHKNSVLMLKEFETPPQSIDFSMPESYNGEETSGYYTFKICLDGEISDDVRFYFMNTQARADFLTALKGQDKDWFFTSSTEGETEYDKMAALMFPVRAVSALSEQSRGKVFDTFMALAQNADISELQALYCKCAVMAAVNEKTGVGGILEMLNPELDGVKYRDITDESLVLWIEDFFKNRSGLSNPQEILPLCLEAGTLYKLKGARSGKLKELIDSCKTELGLSSLAQYAAYSQMSALDVSKVNDKIVETLKTAPAMSYAAFNAAFCSAADSVKSSGQGGSGGSSGAGSGSGGSTGKTGAAGGFSSTLTSGVPAADWQDSTVSDADFNDLASVAWAQKEITLLAKKGIICGTGNGKFSPGDNITREQFAKIIVLSIGAQPLSTAVGFDDVDSSAWYAPYVSRAVSLGICNGISAQKFGVGELITRQDAAVMLARAFSGKLTEKRSYTQFTDEDGISEYAKSAVRLLYTSGKIDGMGGGRLMQSRLFR